MKKARTKRSMLFLTLLLVLALGMLGCSSSAPAEMTKSEAQEFNGATESFDTVFADESMEEAKLDQGPGTGEVTYGGIQTQRKVIQRAYFNMDTLNFDESVEAVKQNTYGFKGYFETMQVDGKRMDRPDDDQYRSAYFVIRIPKADYEFFVKSFSELGNITSSELSSEDITDRYMDVAARLRALKVQEDRVLAILEKAEKIEDIIALEQRLSDIRYERERYTGDINKWDNLVAYTTVTLRIQEVQEIKEPVLTGFWSEAIDGFSQSMKSLGDFFRSLGIGLIANLPYLVSLAVFGVILWLLKKKLIGDRPIRPSRPRQPGADEIQTYSRKPKRRSPKGTNQDDHDED